MICVPVVGKHTTVNHLGHGALRQIPLPRVYRYLENLIHNNTEYNVYFCENVIANSRYGNVPLDTFRQQYCKFSAGTVYARGPRVR